MELKKVNKIKVRPAPIEKIDIKRIKAFSISPELYSNWFICSKKKSGKSTLIFNILKKCIDKDTKIIIFASTVEKDATYRHLVSYFTKKGNEVITYKSLKEGGEDVLKETLESLETHVEKEESDSDKDDSEEETTICQFDVDDLIEVQVKRKKKRKKKYIAPEYFFIFDDLGSELRNASVENFLKKNRHYKAKAVVSSQWLKDLTPSSRRQLDILVLFGGHTQEKLMEIHKELDLSIDFNIFLDMYEKATQKKFNFLYVDIGNEIYRVNFSHQFITQ